MIIIIILGLFFMSSAITTAAETVITGRACAIDGDSLIIGGEMVKGRCRGGDIEIRVQGIDAPEWNQTCGAAGAEWACGEAATAAVRAMIDGQVVACRPEGRDKFKRALATCEAGGKNIARQLVLDGLAMAYRKYSNLYVGEEALAKAARRGIWSGPFMTPGEWRHK